MCKYEMDPMSIVEDTERTRFCPQTDGRTDRRTRWYQYTPLQLRWSGGYNKSPLVKQCWQISMLPFVTGKINKKCSSSLNTYHRTYKGTYGTSQKLYAKKARNPQYKKYFSGYRISLYNDKNVMRQSYQYTENFLSDKTTSLYWDGPIQAIIL